MLVAQGRRSIGECLLAPGNPSVSADYRAKVEEFAGGLLVAMGLGEIDDDLDLEAVALLGAATVTGLQVIGRLEPGLHRLDAALTSLEDLLRRTAPSVVR